MLPRQPRSTLFPYTTLFRSPPFNRWPKFRQTCCLPVGVGVQADAPVAGTGSCRTHIFLRRKCNTSRQAGDRKSTRLNSSHMSISYAVFCLKKKKKKKDNTDL